MTTTTTVTPRQAVEAALHLGDTVTEQILGTPYLSHATMSGLVELVERARREGCEL